MRGSVVKKGDRYYVKLELDPDPATGQRRQKWHSGYRTKREAERARIDLLSKLDRGEYVEPTRQALGDFLEEWLRAIEPTVRPSTFESYSRNMRNHVIAHIGSVRLNRVDAGTLNGLYAHLLAAGRRKPSRTGRGYPPLVVRRALELRAQGLTLEATAEQLRADLDEADHITKDTLASVLRRHRGAPDNAETTHRRLDPRTVNYVHTIVHRAFRDAVRWGRLVRNPADAADAPRGRRKSDGIDSWDAPTLREFLATSSASDDVRYPLWVLLATTGMRRGEALGLRWSDVDLDAKRLSIVQTIIQVRSEVKVGEPKTARGRRPVGLDSKTVAVLREHRRHELEQRLLVGADFEDRDLVFHHPDGSCLKPDAVSAAFVRRVRAGGFPKLSLKGLRHTWATLALEQGVHPKVVQERLGHSTIAVTLDIYSHVSPILDDNAAQLVADLVLSA